METWRFFSECSDYLISDRGTVISLKRNIIFKKQYDACGYVQYNFCIKGVHKAFLAHRLVAMTFLPNENNYPQVNHINGIKADNRVENLEWCTSAYNCQHAWDNGLNKGGGQKGVPKKKRRLSAEQVRQIRSNDHTIKYYSDLFKVSFSAIQIVRARKVYKDVE
jgi:hypothetical protein